MDRRQFLKRLAAATAAAVAAGAVDLDALVWKPGQRTHILPPPRGWQHQWVDWPTHNSLFRPPDYIGRMYRDGLLAYRDGLLAQRAVIQQQRVDLAFAWSEPWDVSEKSLEHIRADAMFSERMKQVAKEIADRMDKMIFESIFKEYPSVQVHGLG